MNARKALAPALALGMLALSMANGASPDETRGAKSRRAAVKHAPGEVAALIDEAIAQKLAEAKVPASAVCDDAEFVRRLSLDIRGRVPPANRVAEFLADSDPDKRSKLIDDFLDDAEYGEHFGRIWYHRMVKPDMDNAGLLAKEFQTWLSDRFNANEGWDNTVRSILTASGERDKNPATVFWLANVEGNQRREVAPNKVAAAASHLFLGVRLECCECHNHPFDAGLKQTDFWSTAAFFSTTHARGANKADVKSKTEPSIQETNAVPRRPAGKARGKAALRAPAPFGAIVIPDSKGKTATARFLLGDMPKLGASASLRQTFADWLASPKNPYFAKASVNKLWANFFGRGIANPVDDMRPGTPNSHPELLDALATEFVASGFDQKHLIRCLVSSRTYQRTSAPLDGNKADEELFSHMRLKALSADMLFDSLQVVLNQSPVERGRPNRRGAAAGNPLRARGDLRDQFRKFFHAEADDDAGVVEEYSHGIPQVLRLMNSQQTNNTTAIVRQLMRGAASPNDVVDGLYLRVLSRRPTEAESARIAKFVAAENDPAKAYGDAMWALLNSAEFMFNH